MRFNIPPLLRNFYFLSALFFVVWVLFLDSNDLINQIKLSTKVHGLESQKEYYENNISEITEKYDQREQNMELIEKFAREMYFMKREDEDLFVIVEE